MTEAQDSTTISTTTTTTAWDGGATVMDPGFYPPEESQLGWCHDVIKLLERQRFIYRTRFSACTCDSMSKVDSKELQALDDEIENIYRRPEAKQLRALAVNTRKRLRNLSSQDNIILSPTISSDGKVIKLSGNTPLLGIDRQSCEQLYLEAKQSSTESSSSSSTPSKKAKLPITNCSSTPSSTIFLHQPSQSTTLRPPSTYSQYLRAPNPSRTNPSASSSNNNNFGRTESIFKCTIEKCRFTCFTRKSLTRHQLQHRRSTFISVIEPHGFTLNQIFEVVPLDPNLSRVQVKIQSCCFPFCQATFRPEHSLAYIINHFTWHISSYILFPCFNCLKVFDTKQSLFDHLKVNPDCVRENVDSVSNGLGFFSVEDVNRLIGTHESSLVGSTTSSIQNPNQLAPIDRISCPICGKLYNGRKWLDVHMSLFHGKEVSYSVTESQNSKPIEVIELDDEGNDTELRKTPKNPVDTNNKKYKCKLCAEPFEGRAAIETHAKFFHNLGLSDILEDQEVLKSSSSSTFPSSTFPSSTFPSSTYPSSTFPPPTTSIVPSKDTTVPISAQEEMETLTATDLLERTMGEAWPGDQLVTVTSAAATTSSGPSMITSTPNKKVLVQSNEAPEVLNFVTNPDNPNDEQQVEYQVVLAPDSDDDGVDPGDVGAHSDVDDHDDDDQPAGTGDDEYMMWDSIGDLIKNGNIQITIDETGQQVVGQELDKATEDGQGIVIETTTESSQPGTSSTVTAPIGLDIAATLHSSAPAAKSDIKQLMNNFIFECSMCTFSFRTEQELALHIYAVHNMTSYNCGHCDYVSQDLEQFRRHEVLHDVSTPAPKFLCAICFEQFHSNDALRAHGRAKHLAIECPVCKISLQNRIMFQTHMTSFHRDSILKCPIESCKYKTYHREMFLKHQKIHEEYKTCSFEGCAEMFISEDKLDAHMNKVHLGEKAHKCEVEGCGEGFYNIKLKQKHLIEVHKQFLFKCATCTFKTNNGRVYQLHLRCHTTERPFPCPEPDCDLSFRTAVLLESHRRHRHSTEKPYSCQVEGCDKSYKTNYQLNQHIKRAHEQQEQQALNKLSGEELEDFGSLFSSGSSQLKGVLGVGSVTQSPHAQIVDQKWYRCPFGECNAQFGKRTELVRHCKNCTWKKKNLAPNQKTPRPMLTIRTGRGTGKKRSKKNPSTDDTSLMLVDDTQAATDSIALEHHHHDDQNHGSWNPNPQQQQHQQSDITTEIAHITGDHQFVETF